MSTTLHLSVKEKKSLVSYKFKFDFSLVPIFLRAMAASSNQS